MASFPAENVRSSFGPVPTEPIPEVPAEFVLQVVPPLIQVPFGVGPPDPAAAPLVSQYKGVARAALGSNVKAMMSTAIDARRRGRKRRDTPTTDRTARARL